MLCPFGVLIVVGSPGSRELPNHVFLARLTVPGMFPPVEWVLNQKGVILLTPIPLLLPQAYLLLLQCTEFIARRDYWWLSPQATYVSPSDTMKASYQEEASRSAPVWFLHILQLMCVMFSTTSSSSGGQPEARQVMIWGSPGHLWPTTWKKISHTWYWDIYLTTYSFWKEHNRLCRVTPIELW